MWFLNLDFFGGGLQPGSLPPTLYFMPAVYAIQNCTGFIPECVCVCVCARTRASTFVRIMLEYRSLATGNNTKGLRQSVLQFRPLPENVPYGECTVSDTELSLKVTNNIG
jgi:hypothetical protein